MTATASEHWRELWRRAPGRPPVNRIEGCEVDAHLDIPPRWVPVHEAETERDQRHIIFYSHPRRAVIPIREQVDPVRAALRVLESPSDALWRTYLTETIEARLAKVDQSLGERIDALVKERVDAALAERLEVARRADETLAKVIAQLKEKTRDNDEELSLDDEAELWKLVDFSVGDDED